MAIPEGTRRLFACRILYLVLGPAIYAKLKLPWAHIVSKPLPRAELLPAGIAPPEVAPVLPPEAPPVPVPPVPTPPAPPEPPYVPPEIPPEAPPAPPAPPPEVTPPVPPPLAPPTPPAPPAPPEIPPEAPPAPPAPPPEVTPPAAPPAPPIPPYVPPPIYIRPWEPGPVHRPTQTPRGVYTEIYGSTLDRWIRNTQGFWTNARNDAGGTSINATQEEFSSAIDAHYFPPDITVCRVFLYFDLSSIPAGKRCASAKISLGGSAACGSQATIQEGTQGDPVTVGDFSKFTGAILSKITWILSGAGGTNLNVFTLNAAGRIYLKSVFGSTAKFCAREYEHDYMDVEPAINTGFALGMYFAEDLDAALRPKIAITYK